METPLKTEQQYEQERELWEDSSWRKLIKDTCVICEAKIPGDLERNYFKRGNYCEKCNIKIKPKAFDRVYDDII